MCENDLKKYGYVVRWNHEVTQNVFSANAQSSL